MENPESLCNRYNKYQKIITEFFNFEDIDTILKQPFVSLFTAKAIDKISRERDDKVTVFFLELDNIDSDEKFKYFIDVTKDVSDWIALLMNSQTEEESSHKYSLCCNILSTYHDFIIDNFTLNKDSLKLCLDEKLISQTSYKSLLQNLETDGSMYTIWRFMHLIKIKNQNFYQIFLYICYKCCKVFIEIFLTNLFELLETTSTDEEVRNMICLYTSSVLEDGLKDINTGLSVPVQESVFNGFGSCTNVNHSSTASRVTNHNECTAIVPQAKGNESMNKLVSDIQEKVANISISNNESSEDINADYTDETFDVFFGQNSKKPTKDLLQFSKDDSQLQLHEYQKELVQHGIEGHNVLICAPTGSGKTLVAIKIVQDHLKANIDAKVAFIVPTTALVDQQYRQFDKYIKGGYISSLQGSSKNTSLKHQLNYNKVFVMTPDILRNSLEDADDSISSIGEFTMIIFDECHHCDKGHSYNKIMDFYFTNKMRRMNCPQIIGMTASTGTDKATAMDVAKKKLFSLCANLDCRIVSTVIANTDELTEKTPKASSDLVMPGIREFDEFEKCLIKFMQDMETKLRERYSSERKRIVIPEDKFHDKYMNFVGNLLNNPEATLSDDCRLIINKIATYLDTLHRALIINNLFRSEYAKEFIQKNLDSKECTFEPEAPLRRMLKDFLKNADLAQDSNPSLEYLLSKIQQQFKTNNDSRIIIIVKEVTYAQIMQRELETRPSDYVRCGVLVGTNKPSVRGGLTKSETDDIVTSFRKGRINVLLCTSIGEEGLDIANCNLVIRYSHVTNEIAMVQTRGRGRQQNAEYIVIVAQRCDWMKRKEYMNQFRESMMYKAIEHFQKLTPDEIAMKIEDLQKSRAMQQTTLNNHSEAKKDKISGKVDIYPIYCKHCINHLFDSSDLAIGNGTSYVVINKSRFENFKFKAEGQNSCIIFCSKCKTSIGQRVVVEGSCHLPCIRIKDCLVGLDGNSKLPCKQWSKVPFSVPNIKLSEVLDLARDNSFQNIEPIN